MKNDLMKMVLKAHRKSFQIAFETAVRTRTALVFMENGKLVKINPPYRYKLVPIKKIKKNKKFASLRNGIN